MSLHEIHTWTNWIESTSHILAFPRPPKELLVYFVARSVESAHSLSHSLDDALTQEVINGHIRSYLVDRVWTYHLLVTLVHADVRCQVHLNSTKLLRLCRKTVARLLLHDTTSVESSRILQKARATIVDIVRSGDLSQV
jgi:hypothetical protein